MHLIKFVKDKIRLGIWFLVRPSLYSQFYYRILDLLSKKENFKGSIEWCENNKISKEKLYKNLNVKNFNFNKEYKSLLVHMEKEVLKSNVNMGGGANLPLLYDLSRSSNAKVVIETGVALGWSSLSLLLSLSHIRNSVLISIDMPYPIRDLEKYVGFVVPEFLKKRWRLIRSSDRHAIPRIIEKSPNIDMIHYDSDKSFTGRMWAYPLLWNKLKNGGYFLSDDINDNNAFRLFCESRKLKPFIIEQNSINSKKYIGIIKKSR